MGVNTLEIYYIADRDYRERIAGCGGGDDGNDDDECECVQSQSTKLKLLAEGFEGKEERNQDKRR